MLLSELFRLDHPHTADGFCVGINYLAESPVHRTLAAETPEADLVALNEQSASENKVEERKTSIWTH